MSNSNIRPLFQSKVDTFCAIYAVLNSFKLCKNISDKTARKLFNETLFYLAQNKAYFLQVLNLQDDYIALVEYMLHNFASDLGIEFRAINRENISTSELIDILESWVVKTNENNFIFRFSRYLPFSDKPFIQHWSTCLNIYKHKIELFDCSLEENATKIIPFEKIITTAPTDKVLDESFFISPHSIYLINNK